MDREKLSTHRAAIHDQLDRKRAETSRRWQLAKQTVWLALIAGAFLIYFLLDIINESISLQ
jgi:hypothetical protein